MRVNRIQTSNLMGLVPSNRMGMIKREAALGTFWGKDPFPAFPGKGTGIRKIPPSPAQVPSMSRVQEMRTLTSLQSPSGHLSAWEMADHRYHRQQQRTWGFVVGVVTREREREKLASQKPERTRRVFSLLCHCRPPPSTPKKYPQPMLACSTANG